MCVLKSVAYKRKSKLINYECKVVLALKKIGSSQGEQLSHMDLSLLSYDVALSDQISVATVHKPDFLLCHLEPTLLFLTYQGQLRKATQQVTEEKCTLLKKSLSDPQSQMVWLCGHS